MKKNAYFLNFFGKTLDFAYNMLYICKTNKQ